MTETLVIDDLCFHMTTGGIPRVWRMLAKSIHQLEKRPKIVLISRTGEIDEFADEIMYFPEYDSSWAAHDRRQIDLLIENYPGATFFSSYYTFSTVATNIQVCYDMIPEHVGFAKSNITWRLRRHGFLMADWVFSISQESQEDLISEFPALNQKCSTIEICSDEGVFFPVDAKSVKRTLDDLGVMPPYCVSQGSLASYKGTLELANVWQEVKAGQLVLTTKDPESLRDYLGNPDPSLIHCVSTSDEQHAALLSGATAYIQSSIKEGYGLPLVESRMCGTPSIYLESARVAAAAEGPGVFSMPALNQEQLAIALDKCGLVRERNSAQQELLSIKSQQVYRQTAEQIIKRISETALRPASAQKREFYRNQMQYLLAIEASANRSAY